MIAYEGTHRRPMTRADWDREIQPNRDAKGKHRKESDQ